MIEYDSIMVACTNSYTDTLEKLKGLSIRPVPRSFSVAPLSRDLSSFNMGLGLLWPKYTLVRRGTRNTKSLELRN